MLYFLRKFNFPVLIIIIFIGILLWFNNLSIPNSMPLFLNSSLMPLSDFFIKQLNYNSLLSQIIGFIFILLQAFYIIYLNKKFILLNTQTYLPVLIFILITSIYKDLQLFHPVVITNFFLLLAYNKVFETYKKEIAFSNFFEASLFISIGSLFYFNFIFFIIFVWIGMIILRPFYIREWIVSLIGLILPHLIIYAFYFLTDQYFIYFKLISSNFLVSFTPIKWNIFYYIVYLLIILMIIISTIHLFSGYNIKKIKARKYFLIILWSFPLIILLTALRPSAFAELFFLLSLPISLILSNFFITLKSKWTGEVMFALLLSSIILIQIFFE